MMLKDNLGWKVPGRAKAVKRCYMELRLKKVPSTKVKETQTTPREDICDVVSSIETNAETTTIGSIGARSFFYPRVYVTVPRSTLSTLVIT